MGKAAKKSDQGPLAGLDADMVREWFRITHLGRLIEDKAYLYIRAAKGWSYHAPFAGHDGIQLALGQAFRANKDFLFPYYRDLLTCLAAVVGHRCCELVLQVLAPQQSARRRRLASSHPWVAEQPTRVALLLCCREFGS